MEAIYGFKLYQLSEYEWYKARNIFEAIEACLKTTGLPFEEACDAELHECTEEEIDKLKYIDPDDGNPDTPPIWTFRERLIYELKEFPNLPGLFASTEY